MTPRQADRLLEMLRAGYPQARKVTDGTLHLYRSLLVELDPQTATHAIRLTIEQIRFFPSWAEIRANYDAIHLEQRRNALAEKERQEREDLEREPTNEERAQLLAQMRDYIATRWAA